MRHAGPRRHYKAAFSASLETGGGPVRSKYEINGVNLRFSEEIARRAIMIRLDTETAKPTEGRVFKHNGEEALRAYIRENRGELVWACLVLIQNWIAKGRPSYSGKVLASFSSWCRVIPEILEAAGIECFNTNRGLLETDDDAKGLPNFFAAEWLATFGTEEVRAGTLEAYAETKPERLTYRCQTTLVELFNHLKDRVDMGLKSNPRTDTLGQRLGTKLSSLKNRIFVVDKREFKLVRRESGEGTLYRLEPKDGEPIARPTPLPPSSEAPSFLPKSHR